MSFKKYAQNELFQIEILSEFGRSKSTHTGLKNTMTLSVFEHNNLMQMQIVEMCSETN